MRRTPIYVEIGIHGELEEIWRLTQTAELHERWDLRFTEIEYLPRSDPQQPQQFRYTTRIGFGLQIAGGGESVGEHHGTTGRTSALKFWSRDAKSLIHEGSGYWKYVPTDSGVRFLTLYDYNVRFGLLGAAIDRLMFRPLMGWATAWSFDRLRLWVERGVDPAVAMQRSVIHAAARTTLAIVWLYQALVPKLFYPESSGELRSLEAAGFDTRTALLLLPLIASAEVIFGASLLLLWRTRSLFVINIAALIVLAIGVFATQRDLFVEQFNPATLNLAMIGLAIAGWVAARDLPTARNCLRRQPRHGSD